MRVRKKSSNMKKRLVKMKKIWMFKNPKSGLVSWVIPDPLLLSILFSICITIRTIVESNPRVMRFR